LLTDGQQEVRFRATRVTRLACAAVLSLADLQALADRGASLIDGDGQALAVWSRAAGLRVTLTVVAGGRGGEATTSDPEQLERAAKAARLHAQQARAWPAPPLPGPQAGVAHDGFDAEMLDAEPVHEPVDGVDLHVEPGAARIAVASTTGVRAAEERSHLLARVDGAVGARRVEVVSVAVGVHAYAAAVDDARELLGAGAGAEPPAADTPVVLGPAAVAMLLDRLRPVFGVDAALGGRLPREQVAAGCIDLVDHAQYPGMLPRSYDAEGLPRRPVALIREGVAHAVVTDSASGGIASTGHATRPLALAPYPEHLVLARGDAAGIEELAEPVADGLYVPALARDEEGRLVTRGAIRIRGGRLGSGVDDHAIDLDPLAVLARTERLTVDKQLLPLPGHCPGGLGSALVPALRAARS
jgi:predicted Zn-dependent protease